jgi:hypothetical protein
VWTINPFHVFQLHAGKCTTHHAREGTRQPCLFLAVHGLHFLLLLLVFPRFLLRNKQELWAIFDKTLHTILNVYFVTLIYQQKRNATEMVVDIPRTVKVNEIKRDSSFYAPRGLGLYLCQLVVQKIVK